MSERILIVDDDQNLLSSIDRRLRKRFTIVTATSAEEALEMLDRDGDFAVVVSDYAMSGMHGLRFLAHVRDKRPTVVRVMLSGRCDPGAAKEALSSKLIFRYLAKPCEQERLVQCLSEALEVHHWLNQLKLVSA